MKRIDLRKNPIALAGLMALAAALKHCPTITRLDLDDLSSTSTDHNTAEHQRLIDEITSCCTSHEISNDNDTLSSLPSDLTRAMKEPAKGDDLISRKISLTCSVPPSGGLVLPIIQTDSAKEDDGQRVPRKLRSPLPSPSPSPSPSPLPSPSGRFRVRTIQNIENPPIFDLKQTNHLINKQVTRVDCVEAPLPSPRSRFTVTPVTAPLQAESCPAQTGESGSLPSGLVESKETSSDYASLIRSSPSKVIVGFDVLTT